MADKIIPPKGRFESKFIPEPNTGCWLWTGAKAPRGYGSFYYLEGPLLAHRVSYLIYRGEIPEGMFVCHKCDVRCCVNPDHLFLGTNQDNMDDMVRKGRARNNPKRGDDHYTHKRPWVVRRGETRWTSKLNNAAVLAIRASCGTQREIARRFGVSRSLIGLIRTRKIWSHLPG